MRCSSGAAADPVSDRSDPAAADPRCFEDALQHVRRRRLAVRAGDADERQLLAWIAVEARGQRGERKTRVGYLDPRHAGAGWRLNLGDDSDGAAPDSVARERRSVLAQSFQRDEE
jgi:hypothetical protein